MNAINKKIWIWCEFFLFTNNYRFAIVLKRFFVSTMGSYTKVTHRYAFELVKAARTSPVDLAEKLQHIKQMKFNYQLKALRKRMNKRIT
tara:strand:- start:291 stop:557 length:267 start_codon:yes stop_codon:yes gene_type:complete